MTRIGKESSRKLEVVIPRRIVQGSNIFYFHYMSLKTYLWFLCNIVNLLMMVKVSRMVYASIN